MYIDFPEGRLKFKGTLMFPKTKYMVLRFSNKDALCEDILESMVMPILLRHLQAVLSQGVPSSLRSCDAFGWACR